MITHSDSIKAISKALFTFQGAVDGVEKNKVNPGFKSRYANLEAVRDTAVPELQKVGLLYIQSPGAIVDGVMAVTTMIIHAESGEWMKFEGDIALGKRDPQGVGSAITYMQRYSLMAALGLPPVDDDGEGAMDRSRPADAPPKPSARPLETAKSEHKTFDEIFNAIFGAADMKALQEAFEWAKGNPNIDRKAGQDLIEAKDQRKEQLTQATNKLNPNPGYVAPNFEGMAQ